MSNPTDKNFVLKCAPNLQITLESSHLVIAIKDNEALYLPLNTLVLLEAFTKPRSVADAISHLQKHGNAPQDWIRLSAAIMSLFNAGVLIDASRPDHGDQELSRLVSHPLHLLLLHDTRRTTLYLDALRQIIRPTDVVLDIGTGSGILAAGAALAGAKHVYAVEGGLIAKVARRVFEANDLMDRVTLIEDWSTQIDLPERADVLVSEILSNGVFGQNMLAATRDAKQRLLKPEARLIPNRVRLYALLTEVSSDSLERQRYTAEQIARWKILYGIDFSTMLDLQKPASIVNITDPAVTQTWTYLTDPILLADIDLTNIEDLTIERSVSATVRSKGIANGVLIFFEADLTPNLMLNTHPAFPESPRRLGESGVAV